MNWMGPGSVAQKVKKDGHFCPQDPGEQERWAEIQRGGVRGKGSLISCSIGLCFLCDGRGQVTVLERGVGVLGREQGLRIQGKVRKGLLM